MCLCFLLSRLLSWRHLPSRIPEWSIENPGLSRYGAVPTWMWAGSGGLTVLPVSSLRWGLPAGFPALGTCSSPCKHGHRRDGADQLQSPSWLLAPLTVSSMGFRGAAAEVSASILRILKGFVHTPALGSGKQCLWIGPQLHLESLAELIEALGLIPSSTKINPLSFFF